jgi:hypothetical protein
MSAQLTVDTIVECDGKRELVTMRWRRPAVKREAEEDWRTLGKRLR